MEDQEDDVSTTEFGPHFIREENGGTDISEQSDDGNQDPSRDSLAGKHLKESAPSKPYLQEMDVLLKSCEKLTGIPFRSRYINSYSEATVSKPSCIHGKEEVRPESHREAYIQPQANCSSYVDTQMDGSETGNEMAEGQSLGTVIHRPGTSYHSEMPLSVAGDNLSTSMLEYEDQLLGMLAMLENCMEEAGMDFEPHEQAGQEYVHINKNPYHHRNTLLMLSNQESPVMLPVHTESCAEVDKTSADGGFRETTLSTRERTPQTDLSACSKERPQSQSHLKVDHDVQKSDFTFSDLQDHLGQEIQDPVFCEGINIGYMFNEEQEPMKDLVGIGIDGENVPAEQRRELKTDLESDMNKLRSQMEDCIEEVQLLEKKRKKLLMEVLQLRGTRDKDELAGKTKEQVETEESVERKAVEIIMILKTEEEGRRDERKKEIHMLREERAEEERKIWKVNLERQGLQDELRRLRRRLFMVARDCAQSQATLNNKRCDVELLRTEEEKLNSRVLQLKEESCQLQQQQLVELQAKRHHPSPGQASNTQEELTKYRRNSCGDVQQFVQSGLKALEDRYEPILMALLKRKEATAGALAKAKEQSQELRFQLKPLREEIQKLKLERTCLEERLKLTQIQREEDASHYKEALHFLEESTRELRTEMEIQKRKIKEMEELRESLNKQLLFYRTASEDHKSTDPKGKT